MTKTRGTWLAALVLAATALLPVRGEAGLLGEVPKDCPPPSYSPCHYWAPTLVRVCDCLRGLQVQTTYSCSEAPITIHVTPFHCPAIDPATLYQIAPYGYTSVAVAPAAPSQPER